ncbi:MAG: murein L,D-transpeptidase [Chitinophagales bacterium]
MSYLKFLLLISISSFFLLSCSYLGKKKNPSELMVSKPSLHDQVAEDLKRLIDSAHKNEGRINDSVSLAFPALADSMYTMKNYESIWTKDQLWLPAADSLLAFIIRSKDYGLFPLDYHLSSIAFIQRVFRADSLTKKNPALWARTELMLSDAFFLLVKHLKQGRLPYDSVTLRKDTTLPATLYTSALQTALESGNIEGTLERLEPRYRGYDSIKAYIKGFLAKANFTSYTYLIYPYKDSIDFFHLLQKRLQELGVIPPQLSNLDTIAIARYLKKYQHSVGLKTTGKLSDQLLDNLNNTDWEKFKKIAVNLDRYKLLPDTLPSPSVWINLPSFNMQVRDHDTLVFQSRIIVGGPQTRTPLLTSEISNFITLPQWTVPYSIIFKEMLPKIQHDVEFLNKENLMVVDHNDSVLDPVTINWKKLDKEHFPYLLKQKQGDENSLGVIKFNFKNKYSVYMHDTNVRWMFDKAFRALSHGCVRLKDWQKMANFLVRTDTVKYRPDTLKAWIARQEKHTIYGFPKLPIYIRYFTCDGRDGRIKFYEDIYEEDRYLREKYFADKSVQ